MSRIVEEYSFETKAQLGKVSVPTGRILIERDDLGYLGHVVYLCEPKSGCDRVKVETMITNHQLPSEALRRCLIWISEIQGWGEPEITKIYPV